MNNHSQNISSTFQSIVPGPNLIGQVQTKQSNDLTVKDPPIVKHPLVDEIVSKFKICGLLKEKLD